VIVRLTTREAAEYLRVSLSTMKRWRREEVGPAYLKIGGRFYYEQGMLDNYIENAKVAR
jgi:excisionase family DNA binding protein